MLRVIEPGERPALEASAGPVNRSRLLRDCMRPRVITCKPLMETCHESCCLEASYVLLVCQPALQCLSACKISPSFLLLQCPVLGCVGRKALDIILGMGER